MQITKNVDKISVIIDGELFTEYIQGPFKPCLYPVRGTQGENLTRHFPFIPDIPEENKDHPWQTGIYLTFGDVNGLDFWNTDEGCERHIKMVDVNIEGNKVTSENHWMDGDTKILSDKTELTFSNASDMRVIEYQVTYIADECDLNFGDNKEGMMAIRMDPSFEVKGSDAVVFNSEGIEGGDVWGKHAQWVTYINQEGSAISMIDHPDNLRHPTRWHARDYGLCAANPFGEKAYCKETDKDGAYLLKQGESLTLKYCFVFNRNPDAEEMKRLFKAWSEDEIRDL